MKFEFQTFSISGTDGVIENCGTKSRETICASESVDQDMSFTIFFVRRQCVRFADGIKEGRVLCQSVMETCLCMEVQPRP